MNTWSSVQPGVLQPFTAGSGAVFRIQFVPYSAIRQEGGLVVFEGLAGRAEFWLDGERVGTKDTFESAPFSIELPPGEGERMLNVLVESRKSGEPAGLGGVVTVERSR